STEDLEPEFVTEVIKTVESILSTSTPKYIGSSKMTGLSFTKFLQGCVEKINDTSDSNVQLSIPNEYESVIKYITQQTIDHCIQIYTTNMNLKFQELYNVDDIRQVKVINWKEFNEIHMEVFAQVEKIFFNSIIGNGDHIRRSELKLNKLINEKFEENRKSNSMALYEYNMELAKKLWDYHVKIGLSADNFFKTKEEFNDAIENFERDMSNILMIDCPETDMIKAKFKSHEYQEAITELNSLQVFNNKLADQIKETRKIELLKEKTKSSMKNKWYWVKTVGEGVRVVVQIADLVVDMVDN
ncbi:3803_t:CDS:2, partial [Funneliformis caledonium]